MLAFDDAALARLMIGASRIAPHERSQWLRRIADKLDTPRHARPSLEGKPASRARRATGLLADGMTPS